MTRQGYRPHLLLPLFHVEKILLAERSGMLRLYSNVRRGCRPCQIAFFDTLWLVVSFPSFPTIRWRSIRDLSGRKWNHFSRIIHSLQAIVLLYWLLRSTSSLSSTIGIIQHTYIAKEVPQHGVIADWWWWGWGHESKLLLLESLHSVEMTHFIYLQNRLVFAWSFSYLICCPLPSGITNG